VYKLTTIVTKSTLVFYKFVTTTNAIITTNKHLLTSTTTTTTTLTLVLPNYIYITSSTFIS
jgi:hypothetical protein